MPKKQHKLAAIVFTDIVGYTKRMEENEQKTMQLLRDQREIVFPLVESYGGEVIKEIGDGLLIMFDSAVEAVRFAISVQTRLKDEELTIRAGIHIGDVIFEGGDVFGSAVNTAARIEPLATPNGICISEDVRSQLHNKSEFVAISCGKKDLKGVKESLEIFEIFIEGVSKKQSKSPGYIFKDLWRRNVIQILLGYVVSAWIIKQAVAAIIVRYVLSPHLIDLTWILLLSLLPTVFLLAYFHGKRSSGKWTRIEMYGLPANFLVSLILLVVLFNGKDLGAATEKITFENEEGEKITRVIPKSEFRKNIAYFFFENKTGNTAYDWLQYGLSTILVYDISQDIFMDVAFGLQYIQKFKDDGYPDGMNAPVMLLKKIAEDYHKDYFVTGSFNKESDAWKVQIDVYKTFNGSKIKMIHLSDNDLFQLVDNATTEIKKAVGISAQQIEKTKDLPVEDVFTSSLTAFENYTRSTIEIALNNDYSKGIEYIEKATEEDSDFALAHLISGAYYFNNNLPEKGEQAINRAMEKLFKLPERYQFDAKFFYYQINQEPDQANAVLKMQIELYPHDINARITLAERYWLKNDFQNAIAQYQYIVQLVPEEYAYILKLGDIYEYTGKYDSSLYYYSIYANEYPNEPQAYKNLGDTYFRMTQFNKAMENYNKAQLIEPENSSTQLKISRVHMVLGEFKKSEKVLLGALPNCKTTMDSITIYEGLEKLSEMTGKINTSFEIYQQKFELYAKVVHPLRLMVLQTFMISKYNDVNKQSEALALLQKIESELEPPLDKISAFGYLFYYVDNQEPEKAAAYIPDAMELMQSFGEEMLIANVYYAEGRIAELKQEYLTGIEKYNNFLTLQPADARAYRWIARCYFENGDLEEAIENIEEAIKRNPNNPKTLYEASRIYLAKGDKTLARENILKANEIWKDADLIYKPAEKARTFSMQFDEM